MSRISEIAAKSTIRTYAQGAAQNMVKNTIGDFLAPSVNVPTASGFYKVYSEKSRYRTVNTRRNAGEAAVRIGWDANDKVYNCLAHAIDCPVDITEQMADSSIENALKEAADLVAETAALSHEAEVIAKANEAASASSIKLSADTNLISDFDDVILDIMKASGFAGSQCIRVLWGAKAWKSVKNHKSVLEALSDSSLKVPSLETMKNLLLGNPESRISFALKDNAPEGKAKALDFLLSDKVIFFVGNSNPTRRDASFMKTFRLDGEWMKAGTYQTPDGRADVAKMDWSEDVQVCNAAAAKIITIS